MTETLLERLFPGPRAKLLRLLHEQPRTVQELVPEMGSSTSAVGQVLRDLEDLGAVKHGYMRTAGRPKHVYSLTHPAVRIINCAIQVADR